MFGGNSNKGKAPKFANDPKEALQYKHLQEYKKQSQIVDAYEKNLKMDIEAKIENKCREIAEQAKCQNGKNKIVVDTVDDLVGLEEFLKRNKEWKGTVKASARNPSEESTMRHKISQLMRDYEARKEVKFK